MSRQLLNDSSRFTLAEEFYVRKRGTPNNGLCIPASAVHRFAAATFQSEISLRFKGAPRGQCRGVPVDLVVNPVDGD
jgi:hypothetical protein